jgi:hypothetical protein
MYRNFVLAFILTVTPLSLFAETPANDSQVFVELHKSGALFDRKQYKKVRAAFARAFEQKYADTIRAAFGDDHAQLTSWLEKKPDVKEELYTAINEEYDDVGAVLKLFARLWKDHPKQIEPYANLAIATAVTWDRPDFDPRTGKRGGVYDYRHHQVRTRSTLPESLANAEANFSYLVTDTGLLNSIKVLPWEFLVFVVDHKTPLEERKWAQTYVKSRRGKMSSWHQDIAYDHGMLKTEQTGKGPGPKLAGHEYTLANIKRYGGVCAQQADFVARVGKSIGQPTMYVSGKSSYRGWHAWVMWVSVVKAGKDSVRFSLVSDGRTRGFEKDAFYVGHLTDPHTGVQILDRDMERRLSVIGKDPLASRQANLAMRAYPMLASVAETSAKDRVAFIDRCLAVSPEAEDAWVELAKMGKGGELNEMKAVASSHLATMTKTFAKYPDFIARLSDDLLTPETSPAGKIKHYTTVATMYDKLGRADLSCDTRLKIAQLQEEQKRYKEAAQTLTMAVRKFPAEGRYILQLLKAYEKVCENHTPGVKPLAGLYLELGPALVRHYRESNPFLDQVLAQATSFFEEKNLTKQGTNFKKLVAQAKAQVGMKR